MGGAGVGRDVKGWTIVAGGVWQWGNNLDPNKDSEKNQEGAAPRRPQRHPAAQPAKGTPMILDRWRGKIVKRLGKFATALREEDPGRIEFIGGLRSCGHYFLEPARFGK